MKLMYNNVMFKNPFKELDQKNRMMSSDLLKQNFDFQKVVNTRAKILILAVFACFCIIGFRLFSIQVTQHEDYLVKLKAYTQKNYIVTPPRGEMVDRNGNLLVANEEVLNITYYPPSNVTNYDEEKWALAYEFALKFGFDSSYASEREWKDYYLMLSDHYGNELLSDEEINAYYQGKLSESDVYALKIARITPELIEEVKRVELTDIQKEWGYVSNADKYIAWPVMMRMERATLNDVSVIIEDASSENVAYLIEHKEEFPGFDVQADWRRYYPYGSTLRDIFGRVSTNGLETDSMDYYLALDYALNDRFGSSGLEKQYEKYLSGERTIKQISFDDESHIAIMTPIAEGKKGYDLQLTIDIELQQKVDQILQDTLYANKDNEYRKNFKQVFVSLMDPNTGEILTMSGQQLLDDGTFIPFASGNYLQSLMPGSVVKLATIYMGLNEGLVQPNELINDTRMCFAGGTCKESATAKGIINDVEAIAQSSNIYMFHIAIRLAGGTYVPNGALYLPYLDEGYAMFRKYYNMFGLGGSTQVDLPFEELGVAGTKDEAASLLDFSIGQYESYTPLQLLQYVSAVGTGVKVKPHFLKQIYEINSDSSVIYQYGTQVISTIDGNTEYLDRVVDGMVQCVETQFCGTGLKALNKNVAAKTGTAEILNAYIRTNSSIIGFAPSDKPTVSFVCSAPDSNNDKALSNICAEIMPKVLEEYYKIYE